MIACKRSTRTPAARARRDGAVGHAASGPWTSRGRSAADQARQSTPNNPRPGRQAGTGVQGDTRQGTGAAQGVPRASAASRRVTRSRFQISTPARPQREGRRSSRSWRRSKRVTHAELLWPPRQRTRRKRACAQSDRRRRGDETRRLARAMEATRSPISPSRAQREPPLPEAWRLLGAGNLDGRRSTPRQREGGRRGRQLDREINRLPPPRAPSRQHRDRGHGADELELSRRDIAASRVAHKIARRWSDPRLQRVKMATPAAARGARPRAGTRLELPSATD